MSRGPAMGHGLGGTPDIPPRRDPSLKEFAYMGTLWFALLPARMKEKVMARKWRRKMQWPIR